MNENYCYLIQLREFIKSGEQIYKIGKTSNGPTRRLSSYPKNSVVFANEKVNNCNVVEKNIIKCFDKMFTKRIDIGTEYYEGDIDMIKTAFYKIINDKYNDVDSDTGEMFKSKTNNKTEMKYTCNICNYKTNGKNDWYYHKKSKNHTNNVSANCDKTIEISQYNIKFNDKTVGEEKYNKLLQDFLLLKKDVDTCNILLKEKDIQIKACNDQIDHLKFIIKNT